MKKVLIIGSPGSGKSTFARGLSKTTGLPLYHLDLIYWRKDKTTVSKEEFKKRLADVLGKEEWIIDGNYFSTMNERIRHADTIFFLDLPKDKCIEGVKKRLKTKRLDMPWIEEELDPDFIKFIENFDTKPIYELLNRYQDKRIYIFRSHQEADEYIKEFYES